MFTGIIVVGWIHHKNKLAIELLANQYWNIPLTFLPHASVEDVNNTKGNLVIFCDRLVQPYEFKKQYILCGPNISIDKFQQQHHQVIVNVLSDWVQKYISKFSTSIFLCTLPLPVDTEQFQPNNQVEYKDTSNKSILIAKPKGDTFLYIKNRDQTIVDLIKSKVKCKHEIVYGSYQEQHFKHVLHTSKFGIWVGSHESQGFALQEALACDVPLLIIDVKSQRDEKNNRTMIDDTDCGVTSAPYWSDKCGRKIYVNNDDPDSFFTELKQFIQDLPTFSPRQFIIDNLNVVACAKRIERLFYFYSPIVVVLTSTDCIQERIRIVLNNMPYAKIVHCSYDTSTLQPWCTTYRVKYNGYVDNNTLKEYYAVLEFLDQNSKLQFYHLVHLPGDSHIDGDILDYVQPNNIAKQTHYKLWHQQIPLFKVIISRLINQEETTPSQFQQFAWIHEMNAN